MKNLGKKRILVTGATGFIGANLLRRLVSLNCESIHIIRRKSSNTWRIQDLNKYYIEHVADIRDYPKLQKVISKIRPQIIFHCAVYGGYAYQDNDKLHFISFGFSQESLSSAYQCQF